MSDRKTEPAPTRYAWRLRAETAEARVKELEYEATDLNEKYLRRAEKAEARVKELEAERDDLLRLGNNHK